MNGMQWYALSASAVIDRLKSDEHGLSQETVDKLLVEVGYNTLLDAKPISLPVIFLRQFQSPIIYILLIAAIIVLYLGEITDSLVILTVLVVNAVIGAIQEGRAQNTMVALKHMVTTNATVLRRGEEVVMPDTEVVPGDMLMLREGDKIPADARIISLDGLKVDESSLTGESEPILKISDRMTGGNIPVADQKNMIFRGTFVVSGWCKAIVVETGLKTQIGAISAKLANVDTEVPLKKNIRTLSRIIIASVLAISALIFMIGIERGIGVHEMFATVVAITVSAIPEGLPVVVTVILATGMYRMSKRNALVKRLQAVEALGQAKIIAVDKTGTVTLNQMMVEELYVNGREYEVTGNGYEPTGDVRFRGVTVEPLDHTDVLLCGKISMLLANASIGYSNEKKEWQRISGDPTEVALLAFARKIGFKNDELGSEYHKIAESPFTSDSRYHAAVYSSPAGEMLTVVGAPEVVLSRSTHIWEEGMVRTITPADKSHLEKIQLKMMRKGLRVLALGARFDGPKTLHEKHLPPLAFVGFVGIGDAIRQEVYQAVKDAQNAGVKVVLITGDHVETAKAISRKVGIYKDGDTVLAGRELHKLAGNGLRDYLSTVSVFARVSPEDKLKIIEAYRKNGDVIAMTGDGVNDALSLAAADLGVSMGKIGTEVAKEAADMVLTDDNFGSIVSAIEEGRNIYRTIKKVILYLFATSLGEILTITGAIMLGYELPLSASQIIWLNFVTDGFLVVALAMEPKEDGLLQSDGLNRKNHRLLDYSMVFRMIMVGCVMMIGSLYIFDIYESEGYLKASAMTLTVLAVFQWLNAWNCKSDRRSIFSRSIFNNKYLIAATFVVIILQSLALHTPFLQSILNTTPLNLYDWLLIILIASTVIIVEEVRKCIMWLYRNLLSKILMRVFMFARGSRPQSHFSNIG